MKMIRSAKFQNMCRTDIVDLEIVTWLVKFIIYKSVIIRIFESRFRYPSSKTIHLKSPKSRTRTDRTGPNQRWVIDFKKILFFPEFILRKALDPNQNFGIPNARFSSLRFIVLTFLNLIFTILKKKIKFKI